MALEFNLGGYKVKSDILGAGNIFVLILEFKDIILFSNDTPLVG